jgi:chemotaxis protein CheX
MEGDLKLAPAKKRGPKVLPGPKPEPAVSMLPQILDLTGARPLRDSLAGLLSRGTVVLDASAVERMSTPCAQVLLAAGRAAGPAGTAFKITNPSTVFRTALADLGLWAEFSNWMN